MLHVCFGSVVYALHQWNPKEKKADHDEGHHGPSKSHHPSKSPSWNHGGDHGGDGGEPVVTSPASFPHFPTTRPLASGRPTDAPTKPGHDGKGPKGPKDHDQDGDGDDGEHWGPSQGHHSHSGGPSKHHGSASWHWHSGSHSHELTKSRGPSSQYHQWNPKPTKPGPDDVLTPTGVVHPGDDGKPKPGKPCKGEVPGDGGKIKPGKPGKGEHPGDGGKPSDGGKDNGGKDNGGKDHGKDNWGPSASARARLNAAKPVDSLYALYGQAAADVCDLESQMPGAEITACPLENGSGWDCLNLASTLYVFEVVLHSTHPILRSDFSFQQ